MCRTFSVPFFFSLNKYLTSLYPVMTGETGFSSVDMNAYSNALNGVLDWLNNKLDLQTEGNLKFTHFFVFPCSFFLSYIPKNFLVNTSCIPFAESAAAACAY